MRRGKRMIHKSRVKSCSSVYRLMEFLAVGAEVPYMVHMVMGHEDTGETLHGKTVSGKVYLQLAKTYSGIDQDTVITVPQIVAVTAAESPAGPVPIIAMS